MIFAAAADPNGPGNMLATAVFWTVGILILAQIGRGLGWLIRRIDNRSARRFAERTSR